MPIDRFVWWVDGYRPTKEEVETVCTDYIKGMGGLEWRGDRWFVTLPGERSNPLARIAGSFVPPELPYPDGWQGREFEVWYSAKSLDVMTREADAATNALAEGLAKVFARRWKGRYDDGQ